jgi:hypothetical protein
VQCHCFCIKVYRFCSLVFSRNLWPCAIRTPPSWLLNYCPQVRVSEVLLQSAATEVNVSLQQPPYISKRSSFTCLIILIFVIQQGVFFGQKVSVHYTCIQLTQESTSKCSNLPQNALCRRWLRSGAVLGWSLHLFARQKWSDDCICLLTWDSVIGICLVCPCW